MGAPLLKQMPPFAALRPLVDGAVYREKSSPPRRDHANRSRRPVPHRLMLRPRRPDALVQNSRSVLAMAPLEVLVDRFLRLTTSTTRPVSAALTTRPCLCCVSIDLLRPNPTNGPDPTLDPNQFTIAGPRRAQLFIGGGGRWHKGRGSSGPPLPTTYNPSPIQ